MIVKNIDNNPSPVAVFLAQPVTASAGMEVVVGKAVDAPMQVQSLRYRPGVVFGNRTFDKIAHQSPELMPRVRPGQKKVYQIIQGQVLRILLCRIRISNAINALLASCWTSTTA